MTLDQPALREVLEVLKAADFDDRIRQAAETIYQAPIEAELSSVIGVAREVARRPPWRRMRWPILRSTLGRVAL